MLVITIIMGIIFAIIGILFIKNAEKYSEENPKNSSASYVVSGIGFLGLSVVMLICVIKFWGVDISYSHSNTSNKNSVSEKQMNDLGYYKENGKWNFEGDGAY